MCICGVLCLLVCVGDTQYISVVCELSVCGVSVCFCVKSGYKVWYLCVHVRCVTCMRDAVCELYCVCVLCYLWSIWLFSI